MIRKLKPRDHIQQTVITGSVILVLGAQAGVRQESQQAHAVGDAHQHHAFLRQPFPLL